MVFKHTEENPTSLEFPENGGGGGSIHQYMGKKELCPIIHTLLNFVQGRVLMASQEVHCQYAKEGRPAPCELAFSPPERIRSGGSAFCLIS